MLHQTDLPLQHDLRLFGSNTINLALNVENLFDQKIVTRRATVPYRDAFNVSDAAFFGGTFDPAAMAAAAPATFRPNATFNLPDQYQGRRQIRASLRWTF